MEEDIKKLRLALVRSEYYMLDTIIDTIETKTLRNVLNNLEDLQKENTELRKGQTSLMQSKKKWKNRYYKLRGEKNMEENNKLTWEDIQNNVNKPVWDNKNKTWVIIEGIQNYRGTRKAALTNMFGWEIYENLELYKEEK